MHQLLRFVLFVSMSESKSGDYCASRGGDYCFLWLTFTLLWPKMDVLNL
jgi:hypothetical protein